MSEQQIQSKILKYLTDQGYYAVKVISANKAGTPDILACVHGHFIAIEVKSEKGRISPLQSYHLLKIRDAGGEAWVVRSLEELEDKLLTIRKTNYNEEWR